MPATTIEEHVLNIVCSVFEAHSAVLFLPEDNKESCTITASFSLGDKLNENAEIVPGQGLVGWIIRNHKILCVPNFDHYKSKLGYYLDHEEESIKAFMGAPLSCGGAICIDSKYQYAFSEKDNRILQLFAELIAKLRVDSGKKDFFEDIPRYFADLSVLQDLPYRFKRWSELSANFLKTLVSATAFDYAAFASMEEPDKTYVLECETTPLLLQDGHPITLSMNNGVVGWVFKNEQPIFSEGFGETPAPIIFGRLPEMSDFKAVICLPIVVEKETRAVLCLAHRSPRHIDESMRSFVHLAVGQLTSFLENLFLRTKVNSLLPEADVHKKFGNK